MSEKPKRILYLTSTSDIGGTERMLLTTLKHLDADRFHADVVSLHGTGELTKTLASRGIQSRNLSITPMNFPFRLLRLYRYINPRKYDIIHTFGLRADTVGRILGRMCGISTIVSSIRSPDPWRTTFHTLLDRITAPFVTVFISNSHAGKQSRIDREGFSAERIVVVHNGIELPSGDITDEKKTRIKGELGCLAEDGPLVLTVANLRKMKGHKDIIDAIVLLKNELPNAKFIFVGRDDSAGDIERYASERNVSDSIIFTGFQEDVDKYYQIADMFVLPSHWEGCPVSVLEAMAHKLPVIATDVGGIPEIIQTDENGILIPQRHPRAIADAITKLWREDSLRERFANNGYETVIDKFTAAKMVKEITSIYERGFNSKLKIQN